MESDALFRFEKRVFGRASRRALWLVVLLFLLSISQLPSALAQNQALTLTQWQHTMSATPTGGFGCFTGTYPSLSWGAIPCGNESAPPEIVGGGGTNDYAMQAGAGSGGFTGVEGWFSGGSGFSSESDSQQGSGYYSIQENSNTYPLTFQGRATTAWTQFVFAANNRQCWFFCGPYSQVFIQWWLIGYGACPANWIAFGNSCYMNSAVATFQYFGPSGLYSSAYYLSGEQLGTGISATFCPSAQCWSVNAADTLALLQNNWRDSEWNVFGYGSGSRANFNAGLSLTATEYAFANVYTSVSCASHSYTGETNNLNLRSCSIPYPGIYQMVFTEGD